MKRVLITSVVALMLCALGTSQTSCTSKRRSLTAREVARRSLPSVVVLIARDAAGRAITLGSGFFVTPSIIATNFHIIENASHVTAKPLSDSETEYAIYRTVATDRDDDLALLRIVGVHSQVTPAHPGDRGIVQGLAVLSGQSEVGDTVYVVGNPERLEATFSQGIISGFRGNDYVQITAPISPGSSGGPVMNQYGEVIGVATLFNQEGQNLNLAVPGSKLISLMSKIPKSKLAPRPRPQTEPLFDSPPNRPPDCPIRAGFFVKLRGRAAQAQR